MDCLHADPIAAFWRAALQYDQPMPTAEESAEALRLHPERFQCQSLDKVSDALKAIVWPGGSQRTMKRSKR